MRLKDDFGGKNTYESIIEAFGEDVVKARFGYIYRKMDDFIIASGYDDCVYISNARLRHVIVDYFCDMLRLKNFHGIEHANRYKIVAYMVYWLNRRQPIQLLKSVGDKEEFVWVNEEFQALMLAYTCVTPSGNPEVMYDERIVLEGDAAKRLADLRVDMFYHLRYRSIDAQSIELLLETYEAAFAIGKAQQKSVSLF